MMPGPHSPFQSWALSTRPRCSYCVLSCMIGRRKTASGLYHRTNARSSLLTARLPQNIDAATIRGGSAHQAPHWGYASPKRLRGRRRIRRRRRVRGDVPIRNQGLAAAAEPRRCEHPWVFHGHYGACPESVLTGARWGLVRRKVYDVVAPILDAGDVRREGVHAGRDGHAHAVDWMEDRRYQTYTRLGVGVHDCGAGVSTIYITEPRCLLSGEWMSET